MVERLKTSRSFSYGTVRVVVETLATTKTFSFSSSLPRTFVTLFLSTALICLRLTALTP